jgi:hypothetical protein
VSVSRHTAPLALFAALAVAWTWPLAAHLTDSIAGDPGDNYSFVWNFWWARKVLAIPGLELFRTTYLFYPFGTTLVDHPHTALPALVGATLLGTFSTVTAQNVVLLAFVFANMACAYALAWDLTRHRRASVLAAMVFGLSPYLAAHLLGHFDLMAAWVLPLFALLLRRALGGSKAAAVGTGAVAVVTVYTTYYYVVYLAIFAAAYLFAWLHPVVLVRPRRPPTTLPRTGRALLAAALLLAGLALVIAATGGTTIGIGSAVVSMRKPQNTLTAAWAFALAWVAVRWRPAIAARRLTRWRRRRALAVASTVTFIFLLGASPLLWRAAQLVARGEYVTQAYVWRNVPLGIDLLSPLIGNPHHPITGTVVRKAYTRLGLNDIEAVGWMGIVPLLILALVRAGGGTTPDVRLWYSVAAAFVVLSLGPLLTIGGFDTGLRLPAILLRYVPFVANARMLGRGMVGVQLALAVLTAVRISQARGTWRAPATQVLLIALAAFESWDAPLRLTALDRPPIYEALAAEPQGGVCEVPLGIGDGLSGGLGWQERRVLYYATVHEHPLVGGFVGRMPADAAARYASLPVAGDLLRLSATQALPEGGGALPALPARSSAAGVAGAGPPCRYLVVHETAGAALRSYVGTLTRQLIAEDHGTRLYRLTEPGERAGISNDSAAAIRSRIGG